MGLDIISFFSLPLCPKMYRYCKEEILNGHSRERVRFTDPRVL